MIQNLLRQKWALPLATPKIVQSLRINLDAKATETEHLWLPQIYISHEKEGGPLPTTKIINFSKFKLLRSWNYAY